MLHITVKTLDSQNHSFTCDEDISVRGFKEYIAETVSVAADSQRLIYCGRVLQDDKKLKDYGNVNHKVIHLVQRVPPQPESRSNNSDAQRQNNSHAWPDSGARVQYRGHLHRNAMYLGAMSVPAEVVEGRGLPVPQLSNTLSSSRLLCAKRMLNKATQLMDRLDDPSVPLHPSPTENNVAEPQPQASAPEEEVDQDGNIRSNLNSIRNGIVQAASELANVFNTAALLNIGLSSESQGREVVANILNENASPGEQAGEATGSQPEKLEQQPSESNEVDSKKSESSKPEKSEPERAESERADASTSNNNNQNTSRRSTPQVPRPPQMGDLLERLISTQDRLRPYIESYRDLMLLDPAGNGTAGTTDNQRIVDGVSECLHYISHACHALSDIIVDMGQQPPRNLSCRPIIIQHSAILQAGIPIQLESHINLTGRVPTNNNTTDEGNEATRPSSPSASSSDQTNRSDTNSRSTSQNANGRQIQSSLLGTFLNLPSNIELSMELNPQSAMDFNSSSAADGTENEQGQIGGSGGAYSMAQPFALIRDALQSVLSERHSQMETSNNASINIPPNIPFVTIVGQQMDIGMPNSGQSTQARSNIGTHPTTSTQTRSTARPHVLHPHTHPYNVGVGMGQSLDFDPILPCNSHHIRRNPPPATNSTSSQSNQANQSTTSENNSRTQSATSTSSTSTRNAPQSHAVNFTIGGDPNAAHIELAMTLGELFQAPARAAVEFSLIESVPNASDISLAELLRSMNVRLEEFHGRNFLIDLWLFWLRNVTFGGLVRLSLGQSGPLVSLRRPLREFLEHYFPDTSQETLQERVVEQIITLNRPHLQTLIVPEEAAGSNRRVDVLATIEALLRKFCLGFLKLLFNNDLDDLTFAQEAVTLAKKLEDQTSAVLNYIFQGGQTTLETIASRFINQLTEGIPPLFQQTLLDILNTRIRANAARTSQTSESEITALLIYLDEPSDPVVESEETVMKEVTNDVQVKQEPQQKEEETELPQPFHPQVPVTQVKKEKKSELKPEPMDTEALPNKIVDDPMDLGGEEIPETFPGAENLPPEWVPIIARDSVYQRRQSQLQAQQGGPIPFSDAYLSAMPSKRRKLIEQQKPQLLASPTANSTAITASVERLVREGIGHSHLEEAAGAANAVAAVPAVRSAFGQAIKDCLHPSRLRTPDFPNANRFPNASKYFADCDKDKEGASKPPTATKTNK